jgi:hypothetical protein
LTHRELTARFNALVPSALKAGVKCKIHRSAFESRRSGVRMLNSALSFLELDHLRGIERDWCFPS